MIGEGTMVRVKDGVMLYGPDWGGPCNSPIGGWKGQVVEVVEPSEAPFLTEFEDPEDGTVILLPMSEDEIEEVAA